MDVVLWYNKGDVYIIPFLIVLGPPLTSSVSTTSTQGFQTSSPLNLQPGTVTCTCTSGSILTWPLYLYPLDNYFYLFAFLSCT